MCGDFLKKRTAQRLGVYRWFLKKINKIFRLKMLYKTMLKKRNENRQVAKLHRKNEVLKATMSQRHEDYYGFVQTG